jgi:hypothetical protein
MKGAIPLITFTVFILFTPFSLSLFAQSGLLMRIAKLTGEEFDGFALRILPKPAVEKASPHFSFWAECTGFVIGFNAQSCQNPVSLPREGEQK